MKVIVFLAGILLPGWLLVRNGSEPGITYPAHFPKPVYDWKENLLDSQQIHLGRLLFYDPILSRDSSISCASCHSPYHAFAHTDHDLSHGIDDVIGTRNAPALFNLAWHKEFMWDGAIHHIDMQALAPISHPGEMGSDIGAIVQKLRRITSYEVLFNRAFQDGGITGSRVLKALSQFQLSLVSGSSRYDRMKLGQETFQDQEWRGYALFKNHCQSCHTEPLFSTFDYASNGLPPDTTLGDTGRWKVTGNPQDSFLFKIPSLRNLTFSYPYMHDGRFRTLREVLDFYGNADRHYTNLKGKRLLRKIELSIEEKTDLIAFLLTLNDENFIFNKNHHFPSAAWLQP